MNKDFVSNKSFFKAAHRGSPPRRTFREMAEEFGVKEHVLGKALQDDGAPKPLFILSNKNTTKNRWYDAQAMRTWWKGRNQ